VDYLAGTPEGYPVAHPPQTSAIAAVVPLSRQAIDLLEEVREAERKGANWWASRPSLRAMIPYLWASGVASSKIGTDG
jgi:hypothetical protein